MELAYDFVFLCFYFNLYMTSVWLFHVLCYVAWANRIDVVEYYLVVIFSCLKAKFGRVSRQAYTKGMYSRACNA